MTQVFLWPVFENCANALVSIVMLALGIQIHRSTIVFRDIDAWAGCTIRLVIAPLLAYLLLLLSDLAGLHLSPVLKQTILIMTSNLKEEELRLRMRPEFINRIDEIVTFDPLSKDDIRKIVRIQMEILRKKLEEDNVSLTFTKAFEDDMVENGYDPEFGARPVKRLIQRELVNQLAKEILEGKVHKDSVIEVDSVNGQTVLKNK